MKHKVFYDKIKIIEGLIIMTREKKNVHNVEITEEEARHYPDTPAGTIKGLYLSTFEATPK